MHMHGLGKSITYQVPGSMHQLEGLKTRGLRGMVLVVSPLLSLIQNQWQECQRYGVAAHILTGNTVHLGMLAKARDAIVDGTCQIVFATPEQATKDTNLQVFDELYSRGLFTLAAIDEAHCASEWGRSFRPDYLHLGLIRERFPKVPILAVTATACSRVRDELCKSFGLHDPLVLTQSVDRPNLRCTLLALDGLVISVIACVI